MGIGHIGQLDLPYIDIDKWNIHLIWLVQRSCDGAYIEMSEIFQLLRAEIWSGHGFISVINDVEM